jgi:hypothetical protein
MIANLVCGLSGHKINRRKVWHDEVHFRTDCDRCGRPLIRALAGWELFDEETHADPHRAERGEKLAT